MTDANNFDKKTMLREQFYFPHQQNRSEIEHGQPVNIYPMLSELHCLLRINVLAPHSMRVSHDVTEHDWGTFSSLSASLENKLPLENSAFNKNDATYDENDNVKGITYGVFTESSQKLPSILQKNRRTDEPLQPEECNLKEKRQSDKVQRTATSMEHTKYKWMKQYNRTNMSTLPSNTSRSNRYKYEEIRDVDRYRKIEDLALYVSSGVINEQTRYFIEPMQRRIKALDELELSQQHGHASRCRGDPRSLKSDESSFHDISDYSDTCFENEKQLNKTLNVNSDYTLTHSSTCIVPKRTLESLQVFNSTAGLVKPYAISRSVHFDKHYLDENISFDAKNCMEAYVTSMRAQRPTKGLHINY